MANTYTQIYLHVVFAVSGRACLIQPKRKEELQKYITGIVSGRNQKLIAINCMPDHTHILLGLKPDEAPSDLIGRIKTGSTNHINEQRWIGCRFSWQEGFGAFSVSHSHLSTVIDYIQNQEIIIAANHFSRNMSNFWNAMMWPTMGYTFLNPLNDSKHVAPNGAFGLLMNDSYRPIAPAELQRYFC